MKQTDRMLLFHAGFQEIREPDIRHGRKNADFGQGFYLTAERKFAERWAREQAGNKTLINTYELDLTGLSVRKFTRTAEWFDYINSNRNRQADRYHEDVIIGPVANDTIFDVLGIITSGFLTKDESLRLLLVGPEYEQTVIKTEKAAAQLHWLDSTEITREKLAGNQKALKEEEEKFRQEFAGTMVQLFGEL